LKTYLFKPQQPKMDKARDISTITKVHNGRGSIMEEMDLVVCMNETQDGQHRESELVRKNGKRWSMLRMLRESENGQNGHTTKS
jgi:hypothetical protein